LWKWEIRGAEVGHFSTLCLGNDIKDLVQKIEVVFLERGIERSLDFDWGRES